mmetsp:Transcript_17245/g.32480  ORF Transcript_17245/g.32480 Transcript_17245/m.32480 type:complete len:208 (+) Transcript_17245:40-663(+)
MPCGVHKRSMMGTDNPRVKQAWLHLATQCPNNLPASLAEEALLRNETGTATLRLRDPELLRTGGFDSHFGPSVVRVATGLQEAGNFPTSLCRDSFLLLLFGQLALGLLVAAVGAAAGAAALLFLIIFLFLLFFLVFLLILLLVFLLVFLHLLRRHGPSSGGKLARGLDCARRVVRISVLLLKLRQFHASALLQPLSLVLLLLLCDIL